MQSPPLPCPPSTLPGSLTRSYPCSQSGGHGGCRSRRDNKLGEEELPERAPRPLPIPVAHYQRRSLGAFYYCLVCRSVRYCRAFGEFPRSCRLICDWLLYLSSLGIYFKRPSRLFRPSRGMYILNQENYQGLTTPLPVDTLATLRQLAMSSHQTLSPAFIRALIKDKGVCSQETSRAHGGLSDVLLSPWPSSTPSSLLS